MNRKSVFEYVFISCFFMIFGLILFIGIGAVPGETRLKADIGLVCLDCHPALKKELAEGRPHKALKSNECMPCHTPHAAQYENLLIRTGDTLCYGCHESQKSWLNDKVVHLPVEYGECLKCHEPHVSPYKDLLRLKGKEMCFLCHEQESFQKAYVHSPVKDGRCNICHRSHSSSNPFLLPQPSPKLCLQCHSLNQKLISKHPNYRIDQADCLLCHNPHSSKRKNLVYSMLHEPFKKNDCNACHPESSGPIGKASGDSKSCYKCHEDAKKRFDEKGMSHIVPGKGECIFCHNPHAAEREDLVRRGDKPLCTSCHPEMGKKLRVVRKGLGRHPDVMAGRCSTCHDAHSSDDVNFLRDTSLNLCTECHSRQKVACHPVGEKAMDPRSDTPINCITCHNPMESEFPQLMRLDGAKELCNQCHAY